MHRVWCVAFLICTPQARAVDGAGLQLVDIVGLLAMLFGAALPFILVIGAIFLLVKVIGAVLSRDRTSESQHVDVLPPAIGSVQFSDEEAEMMNRCSIYFNGTRFRWGDKQYQTLAEALKEAQINK